MTQRVCVAIIPSKVPNDTTGLAAARLNQLYEVAVAPAVSASQMELIHVDPTVAWPLMERQLFDNLLLSDAAIFDITDRIPEVFYLLGIRLALRPESTILLEQDTASNTRYPAIPVTLSYCCNEHGKLDSASVEILFGKLSDAIANSRSDDAMIKTEYYSLLREYRAVDISRTKTDRFRTTIRYQLDFKTRLSNARALERPDSLHALRQIETELVPADTIDSAIFVDLFLSYRAEGAWEDVCRLYQHLPRALKRAVMIREQYALAMNRQRIRRPALEILEEIEAVQGPSSETCSLIGRVYKDLWQDCEDVGDRNGAAKFLGSSISAYRRGFKADWRDAYPGVNLLTLLDVEGKATSLEERNKLLPIVRFAAEQRVDVGTPDYWDYATLLELSILEENGLSAKRFVYKTIERVMENWQPETTANNLRLLQRYRRRRQQDVEWMSSIISALDSRART